MKCPECGANGPFQINFRAWITVYEDETTDYEIRKTLDEIAIKADSPCICLACDLEMGYSHFCES